MSTELHKVLQAREDRAEKRQALVKQGLASLSLSLNIPGYPKSTAVTEQAFSAILSDLKLCLKANRIVVSEDKAETFTDEAGQLYLIPLEPQSLSLREIKDCTEQFEIHHGLGRIIDVDVFNAEALPVSSGKKKACVICGHKAAVQCMRDQTHEYDELRAFIFKMMDDYQSKQRLDFLTHKLSEIASQSLLYEVSLTPKPGLVDFNNSGSHQDMNYYSFLNSISALSPYWQAFAEAGYQFASDLCHVLPEVRQIGLKMERAMFEASQNVNTQKGLIFLLGLSIFTIAYLDQQKQDFVEADFIQTLKAICNNIVEKELVKEQMTPAGKMSTHGETTFEKYGMQGAGVRYEAQNGLPIVFQQGLPFLEKHLKALSVIDREAFDDVLRSTLLKIMSQLNDSNVLYRKGPEVATQLKDLSELAFEDQKHYKNLNEFCLKEHISPGGSADILALSLFFYFVKQAFRKVPN